MAVGVAVGARVEAGVGNGSVGEGATIGRGTGMAVAVSVGGCRVGEGVGEGSGWVQAAISNVPNTKIDSQGNAILMGRL